MGGTATANTKYGVSFAVTGATTAKNTACNGGWMAGGTCMLGVMWMMPAANATDEPTMFAKLQVIQAQCGTSDLKTGKLVSATALGAMPTLVFNMTESTVDAAAVTAPTQVSGKGRMDLLTGVKTAAKNPISASIFVNGMTSIEYTAMTVADTTAAAFTDGYTMTSQLVLAVNMGNNAATGETTFSTGVCYACTATTCTDKSAYCHVIDDITAADPTTIPQNSHAVRISLSAAFAKLKLSTTAAAATLQTAATVPTYATKLNAAAGLALLAPVASTAWVATALAPVSLGCA